MCRFFMDSLWQWFNVSFSGTRESRSWNWENNICINVSKNLKIISFDILEFPFEFFDSKLMPEVKYYTYKIRAIYISITKESLYNGVAKPRIRTFNLLNGLISPSHFNLLNARLRACSHYEIAASKLVDLGSSRAWLKSKWKRFTIGYCHYIESLYSGFIQLRRCNIDLPSQTHSSLSAPL